MNNLDENARKKFLFLDKNNQYFPQIIDKEHHVIKKVLVIPLPTKLRRDIVTQIGI
jgi:hypothetical protein